MLFFETYVPPVSFSFRPVSTLVIAKIAQVAGKTQIVLEENPLPLAGPSDIPPKQDQPKKRLGHFSWEKGSIQLKDESFKMGPQRGWVAIAIGDQSRVLARPSTRYRFTC